jgi:hypothetical protein
MRPPLWLCVILGSAPAFSACVDAARTAPARQPAPSFEELRGHVERIRGLSFQQEVSLTRERSATGRTPPQAFLMRAGSLSMSQIAAVSTRLGILPEDADLSKILAGLEKLRRGIRYDPLLKTLVIPDPFPGSIESLIDPVGSDRTPPTPGLIRGLARALQEQHFQGQEKLDAAATTEVRLALRAVVEGDAALAAIAYLAGEPPSSREALVAGIQDLRSRAEKAAAEFPDLPPFVRQQEIFPYVHGSLFVLWAYAAKGWEGVNALYRHPPRSTEQVLHPERYYVRRKDPVRIEPWGLLRILGGRTVSSDTLGLHSIRQLLTGSLAGEGPVNAGSGWAGDRLMIFSEGAGLGIAWITAWESAAEAGEFYQGYRRVLERNRRVVMGPAEAATAASAEGSWLESKERFVFFLDGLPPERSGKVAAELWRGLEVGPDDADTETPPFELAGGPLRLGLSESVLAARLAHPPLSYELDEMRLHGASGGR